jgi:arylsulfatase A-like enzyme
LLVFADQLRGRDLGCMGNRQVATPELDRLAADGVLARRCYANTPVCTPNRGTLLTGRLPLTHGALGNDLPLRPDVPSIGVRAAEAGWRTGYVGKWHLDGIPREKFTPPGPRRAGFDFWAAYNCTHDYLHPRYYRDEPEVISVDGYEPVVQTDLALGFLDGLAADERFCLFLSWGPPHDPYDALPAEYRGRVDPDSVTLAPNVDLDTGNPLAARREIRRTIADYYAAIGALDEQFGRLMSRLDALGRRQDTIVVFTSDHGDMLWAHGWMKKQLPYEESAHVPLLVRWPAAIPAGTVRDAVVSTADLAPTIAAALGAARLDGADGRDVLPELTGSPTADDDAALLANHLVLDEGLRQGVPEWRGLRTARHTYAERLGRVPWLLFDNEADPWQMRNLVDDPACGELQAEFAARLRARLDAVGDPFLDTEGMADHCGVRAEWDERVAWRAADSGAGR